MKFKASLVALATLSVIALVQGEKEVRQIPVFSDLQTSSSGGQSQGYGSKSPSQHIALSSASASAASSSGGFGSGESSGRSPGSTSFVESGKHFIASGGHGGGGSFDYAGAAESSGGYPNVQYPSSSQQGGYPSSPPSSGPVETSHTNAGPAYTYYYQHYPSTQTQGQGGWAGAAGGDTEGHAGLFGDLGGGAGLAGLGGLGGIGGLGILGAAAKGLLALKPFLLLGLLLLISLPILLLIFPIPIITITGNTAMNTNGRSSPGASSLISYVATLSEKVLNSEECLERVLCKLPQAPGSYKKKAKALWDQYGEEFVKNSRVSRGLGAYFETNSSKNHYFKCNQKFQCSNKFL